MVKIDSFQACVFACASCHALVIQRSTPTLPTAHRWNEEVSHSQTNGEGSILDGGDTEHNYDGQDEGLDELSELGREGVDDESQWSESSPTRSDVSLTPCRQLVERGRERGFTGMSSLPDNVGTVSVASWDAGSEPTMGTDGGTDQDIVAASGLPEDDSEDDDEEDDEFEVADSLDLGAVALCVSMPFCYSSVCKLGSQSRYGHLRALSPRSTQLSCSDWFRMFDRRPSELGQTASKRIKMLHEPPRPCGT